MPKSDYLLDEPADSAIPSTAVVPNMQPKITGMDYRLALIGEAPGVDEAEQGVPFVGYSGQVLNRFLSRFSILRDACFVGNVCRQRPASNKIANFDWNGPEISSGLAKLSEDLKAFRPNVVLLLGGSALHAFKNPNIVPKKRKGKDGLVFNFPDSISDWRGSFFESHLNAPLPAVKCIASYHPAACLRQYEWTPMLMLDIQRAFADAKSPELVLPKRELLVGLTFQQTIEELDKILQSSKVVGCDIEGWWKHWRCISFAPTPSYAFIVPFTTMKGESCWTLEEETKLVMKVVQILASTTITKTWMNGLYDRWVLQRGFGIVTRGHNDDIMLSHWEIYCELEKALGVQNSIYTREPYYKGEVDSDDQLTFHRYCCRDSATTLENFQQHQRYLKPESQRHYKFNAELISCLVYMQEKGFNFNKKLALERKLQIEEILYDLQYQLDQVVGTGIKAGTDKAAIRVIVRDVMCYKRDSSIAKADCKEDYEKIMPWLLSENELTKFQLGQIGIALGLSMNIKSTAKWCAYLYDNLKLPEQKDPLSKARTADFEALITLRKKTPHPAVELGINIGELRTRLQHVESMLSSISDFHDGRVHSFYNEVGSETGRVTCSKLFKKYGYPLQTVENENTLKALGHPLRLGLRDLLQADDGCYLAKCDLKGADGWTVGANLAALGDATMLDDLRYGLKPANVLCYASRHGAASIVGKSREELKEMCKEVGKDDWDYFAYKQCIWGFCYLMGVRKAAQHVFNVSEGTVIVSEQEMETAKLMLIRRYSLPLWWKAMEQKLFTQPYPPRFQSPSGHERKFFGRKADIVGEALAHEPQSITTYATNLAMSRLWKDPENRYRPSTEKNEQYKRKESVLEVLSKVGENGGLFTRNSTDSVRFRIEPIHQVHDEMVVQFRIEDSTWAVDRIKQYFNNEIIIAGIKVVIPYDGAYGTDWSMSEKSKVGTI